MDEPAVLAFAVDGDVNLALEGVELEGLGDLDELELLRLGELRGETEGSEVVEDRLLGNIRDGRRRLPVRGREGRNVLHRRPPCRMLLRYQ